MTKGYSGSDIVMAVQDALMQPVREIQTKKHYEKVKSTSAEPRGTKNTPHRGSKSPFVWTIIITAYSPRHAGGIELMWTDVNADKLLEAPLAMKDFIKVVTELSQWSVKRI